MQPSLASSRELVELLDSEPLFDYLIQNGALDRSVAAEILEEPSPVKVNLSLIKHVEQSGKNSLFVNALRVSGQHYLANLLDEGQRIKALTGSGFLSKSKHKGQVSVRVLVKAIKLEPESFEEASPLTSKEWISLEDIQVRLASLTRPKPISLQPVELTDPEENTEQCCGWCSCITKMFSTKDKSAESGNKVRSPRKDRTNRGSRTLSNQPIQIQMQSSSGALQTANNGGVGLPFAPVKQNDVPQYFNMADFSTLRTPRENRSSVQSLRNLANTVQEKSEVYYEVLRDPSSGLRDEVVRYFEQDRGVLILDTQNTEGFVVSCICMKQNQVTDLKQDYNSGKLLADLEKIMVTDRVLEKTGATAVQLDVDINYDELEQAEMDLMS